MTFLQSSHGHWKTTTFLAALRHDRIEAPWLLDGPIDGESFTIYIEKLVGPQTRCQPQILVALPATARAAVMQRREHKISTDDSRPLGHGRTMQRSCACGEVYSQVGPEGTWTEESCVKLRQRCCRELKSMHLNSR
jgi:hypothetical protein